jgi:2-polyprenyl-3-methyl-5-hydroxy-6-metoxy-1,4-benzoquinol methylase
MKVAVLIVATGRYVSFVEPLCQSLGEYLLCGRGHQVDPIVFSDKPQGNGRISLAVDHRPWPYATLMRFHMFSQNAAVLEDYDYVYYCDADMRFVSPIGEEIFGSLVGTQHPYFFDVPRSKFHYEGNPSSTAFVPDNKGTHYFIGAFFGGRTKQFLDLCNVLKHRVDSDLNKGYIAKWHDESHLNRYFADTPPEIVLDPGFCYPEGSNLPFTAKVVALKKDNRSMRFGLAPKKIKDPSRPREYVRQEYWDKINRAYEPRRAAANDKVRNWMAGWLKRFPKVGGEKCIEIGCCPGRYIPMMSEAGYTVSGVDLTPEVTSLLPDWLRQQGCSIDSFVRADFRLHDFADTYDLVYSVGFLEHFEDWQSVLAKHAQLVSPGGWLMLSVPNFRGPFQRWPRWYLDKENFYRHNLQAMQPQKWAGMLRSLEMQVIEYRHFGGFDFWVDPQPRTRIQTLMLTFIARHKQSVGAKIGDHATWSPFCGIVARRPRLNAFS